MMLLDVLQGAEDGGFVVIKDTVSYCGRSLLKYYMNCALKREDAVHVLGFEVPEQELFAGLDSNRKHLFHFHNAYSDPLGWTGQSSFTVKQFCTPEITRLIHEKQQGKASVLIIDSLSWVLRHCDPVFVSQELQKLKRGGFVKTIIGLLHIDLHQQGVIGTICHLASTVIFVTPASNAQYALAKTTWRKKSGKVMQEHECFRITEDLTLCLENKAGQHGHLQTDTDSNEVDPTLNLTFNLRLSAVEKEAKEKVTLPFIFSEEKKSALLRPNQGSGHIMYEPDANDDFDDEDPDDDLDV